MSLSDLASLGSFISGVAVLVSLVFLYFQLRQITEQVKQAEKNQRAATHQARQQARSNYADQIAYSDNFELFLRGASGDLTLSEVEAGRYIFAEASNLFTFEEWFYQHLDGMIDERRWQSNLNSLRFQLATVGFRVAWQLNKRLFGSEFVAFMDALVQETQAIRRTPASIVERWRVAIAAESAGPS